MKRIPVDTNRLSGALCVSAPEVKADPNTGEVRMDKATGQPVYLVGVSVKLTGERKAYVLDVAVPGEPVGVVEGAPVRVFDLVAVPWEVDGRSGMSYRASAVTTATAAGGHPPEPAPAARAGKGGDA
jgi:hypothetical protein